jgi:hypothetical protein
MLTMRYSGAILLVAFVFLLYLAWVLTTTSSFNNCVTSQTTAATEQAKNHSLPRALTITDYVPIYSRCVLHVVYEYRDAAIAVATIFIAIFTLTLWLSTYGLLKHGREVERAYISCGGARESRFVSREIVDGKTVEVHEITNKFQFHVNNYGKTPGTVFRIRCGFCEEGLIPKSTPTYKYDVYRHSPIDPDRRSLPLAVFPIPPELKGPAVFGRVSYKTIFGDCFSSAFIYKIPLSGEVEAIRPPNKLYLQEQREKDDSGEAKGNAA